MEAITATVIRHARKTSRLFAVRILVAGVMAGVGTAAAQPTLTIPGSTEQSSSVALTLGGGYSDNLLQDGANARSGSYTSPGFAVDLARETQRFRAVANGNMEYRNYSVSSVENETFGDLAAELEFRIVPERFSWLVQENYDQGRVDPFTPTGPDNREQVNMLATGPVISLPFGQRTSVRLYATAGARDYDELEQFDADTQDAGVGFYHALSATTEIGIGGSAREVDYDTDTFDNEIETAFVAYRKQFSSGAVELQVGTNEVIFGNETESAGYINLGWARDVGARSRLSFTANNELVDAGDSFRGGIELVDEFISFDVYERTFAGTSLATVRDRSEFELSVGVGEDRYQNAINFDTDYSQIGVSYQRDLANAMEFGANLTFMDREFITTTQIDKDYVLGLSIARQFSRQLSLRADFIRNTRGSGSRSSASFDENMLWFHVRYDINSRRTPELLENN